MTIDPGLVHLRFIQDVHFLLVAHEELESGSDIKKKAYQKVM